MDCQTSIIITSHNNFHMTTGPCLGSLKEDKEYDRFEIIIVDNASQDGSLIQLKRIATRDKNVKLISNTINRGYAGGNNDGASVAQGGILVLLNSDTIVPSGSIGRLSELLNNNRNWALLGPVTNEAGNEQKIYVQSTQPEQILQEGKKWCSHSNHHFFKSERLDFFCVAMLKETYEKLGGLDEDFGLGYYEDTDFSIRAKQIGLNMMFTEDIFVCHKAGGTFSRHGKEFVRRLMRENKKKLNRKHSYHIRLYHMRDRNIHVMNEYIVLKENSSCASQSDLDYKFQNRLLLANCMYPNNPLKKMFYYAKLKNLCKRYYR
jgi:GT2 family glycosyltransferase